LLYYVIICIKKTLRCNVIKTVSGKAKTAAAEKTFRKIFKKEKTDVDEKKNTVNIEENTKAFKSIHC